MDQTSIFNIKTERTENDGCEPNIYNEECLSKYYNLIEENFNCCLCTATLFTREKYEEHLEAIHAILIPESEIMRELQCEVCQEEFDSVQDFESHRATMVREVFECIYCGERFDSSNAVGEHFSQVHSVKVEEVQLKSNALEPSVNKISPKSCDLKSISVDRYCCVPRCCEAFPNEELLVEHVKLKHTAFLQKNADRPSTPYKCNACLRSFNTCRNLRSHENRRYHCLECPFRAVSRNHLATHQRLKHSGERPFKCTKCDKSFVCDTHLKAHEISHSTDRPFVCDLCKKTFRRKDTIKSHMRLCHMSEKPYECEMCSAKFKTNQCLEMHSIKHFRKKKKPFRCSQCEESFYQIANRVAHELTHNGLNKGNSCPTCGVAIKNAYLNFHMQIHGEGPHSCKSCGKAFYQSSSLKMHLERCEQ